jgi:hypothetical protein
MDVSLYDYQIAAINKLRTGSILQGGVGSGKSRTAIAYYFIKSCGGSIKINGEGEFSEMTKPKDLYIITTAKKRDSQEWQRECAPFILSTNPELSINGVKVVIDSWNNISKYISVKNAFFLFDEQRLVGSGTWVKAFIRISKFNDWILLTATPGDVWTDFIPVFVANGFYKNKSEFLRTHAVYSRFAKYPKIEKFIDTNRLYKYRDQITVKMEYKRNTSTHDIFITVPFDKDNMDKVVLKRWNIFKERPIQAAGELCYVMRRVANEDPSRLEEVKELIKYHPKVIIFYNFDYELEILRALDIPIGEWNGHKHDAIPKTKTWAYLVQYSAGAEGWNCIETDVTIFYSQNYSYKIMVQAAGRIDRLNTPYSDLYYYHLRSNSAIDLAITKALKAKKNFNVNKFIKEV